MIYIVDQTIYMIFANHREGRGLGKGMIWNLDEKECMWHYLLVFLSFILTMMILNLSISQTWSDYFLWWNVDSCTTLMWKHLFLLFCLLFIFCNLHAFACLFFLYFDRSLLEWYLMDKRQQVCYLNILWCLII